MPAKIAEKLRVISRKFKIARAIEDAAAVAAGVCFLSAIGLGSLLLGQYWGMAGISILPVAAAIAVGAAAYKRMGFGALGWLVLSLGIMIILLAMCAHLGVLDNEPTRLLMVWTPLVAAFVACTMRLLRPMSPSKVAGLLDARLGLSEQLVTAEELACKDVPGAFAQAVSARALHALENVPAGGLRPWRRTAATPAALVLGAMLCTILWLGFDNIDVQAGWGLSLTKMSSQERDTVAQSLRQAASQHVDQQVAMELTKAATVIEANNAHEFERIAKRLRELGFSPLDFEYRLERGSTQGEHAKITDRHDVARRGQDRLASGNVRVADAGYTDVETLDEPMPRPWDGDVDDAWSAALERAAQNPVTVPGKYHSLIRDFFMFQDD